MRTVLIVEDDAQAATAAMTYFADKYKCFLARDYCEAIDLLQRRYDFVVTDTFYPQETGSGLKETAARMAEEVLVTIRSFRDDSDISPRVKNALYEWVNNPDESTQPMGLLLIRTLLEMKYVPSQIVQTTHDHHGDLFEPIWVCICNEKVLPSFPPHAYWPRLYEGNKHCTGVWEDAYERFVSRWGE